MKNCKFKKYTNTMYSFSIYCYEGVIANTYEKTYMFI